MPEDKNKKDNLNDTENKELKDIEIELAEDISGNDNSDGSEKIASSGSSNTHLRRLISTNYLEYSSYVIKERAIPELRDGFKPVQRRILWSLYRMDDGKFHKVANVVGHSMQYHPHGDSSIYQALVNLANKEYFIDKQGNFGNIFTGDNAAAGRYIEARLTPLGREVLFNPEITEFTESYDGRNKEPVFLPAKVPVVLMVGQEGIAPGMTTSILSHNFKELLEAQIAVLKKEDFIVYPDFLQGGIMDVSEYNDGEGKITLRAKIDIDGRRLVIREVPAFTNTEKLISSIEKAVNKNKIKLAAVNDYTAENVEIELIPARGYNPEKALKALYMYTDCEMSVSSSILVIKDNRPLIMTVSEIIREYTDCLVGYLRAELQIQLDKLKERFHERTLERIFIENRIYKRIEECETYELVHSEVRKGLEPFLDELKREVTKEDIEKLLAIPIRRISKFDINKNREETAKILEEIKEVERKLKHIIKYSIDYIEKIIAKYAVNFPRKTKIKELEEIDKKAAALNNIKVGWDRKDCYIGQNVKSDEVITCNEYDHLICIEKSGEYKVISIPQKSYVGRLYYFNKYAKDNVYCIIYKERKSGTYFVKRCVVDKFIRDKVYKLIPKGCQLEQLTIRDNSIYECLLEKAPRQKVDKVEVDFSQVQMRNPGARGFKLTDKKIKKISFLGFAEVVEEEKEPEFEDRVAQASSLKAEEKEKDKVAQASSLKSEDQEQDNVETSGTRLKENTVFDKDVSINEKVESKEQDKEKVAQASSLKAEEQEKDKVAQASSLKSEDQEQDNVETSGTRLKENTVLDKDVSINEKVESKEHDKEKVAQASSLKAEENEQEKAEENDQDDNGDDEDWGIIQPDLGF